MKKLCFLTHHSCFLFPDPSDARFVSKFALTSREVKRTQTSISRKKNLFSHKQSYLFIADYFFQELTRFYRKNYLSLTQLSIYQTADQCSGRLIVLVRVYTEFYPCTQGVFILLKKANFHFVSYFNHSNLSNFSRCLAST